MNLKIISILIFQLIFPQPVLLFSASASGVASVRANASEFFTPPQKSARSLREMRQSWALYLKNLRALPDDFPNNPAVSLLRDKHLKWKFQEKTVAGRRNVTLKLIHNNQTYRIEIGTNETQYPHQKSSHLLVSNHHLRVMNLNDPQRITTILSIQTDPTNSLPRTIEPRTPQPSEVSPKAISDLEQKTSKREQIKRLQQEEIKKTFAPVFKRFEEVRNDLKELSDPLTSLSPLFWDWEYKQPPQALLDALKDPNKLNLYYQTSIKTALATMNLINPNLVSGNMEFSLLPKIDHLIIELNNISNMKFQEKKSLAAWKEDWESYFNQPIDQKIKEIDWKIAEIEKPNQTLKKKKQDSDKSDWKTNLQKKREELKELADSKHEKVEIALASAHVFSVYSTFVRNLLNSASRQYLKLSKLEGKFRTILEGGSRSEISEEDYRKLTSFIRGTPNITRKELLLNWNLAKKSPFGFISQEQTLSREKSIEPEKITEDYEKQVTDYLQFQIESFVPVILDTTWMMVWEWVYANLERELSEWDKKNRPANYPWFDSIFTPETFSLDEKTIPSQFFQTLMNATFDWDFNMRKKHFDLLDRLTEDNEDNEDNEDKLQEIRMVEFANFVIATIDMFLTSSEKKKEVYGGINPERINFSTFVIMELLQHLTEAYTQWVLAYQEGEIEPLPNVAYLEEFITTPMFPPQEFEFNEEKFPREWTLRISLQGIVDIFSQYITQTKGEELNWGELKQRISVIEKSPDGGNNLSEIMRDIVAQQFPELGTMLREESQASDLPLSPAASENSDNSWRNSQNDLRPSHPTATSA